MAWLTLRHDVTLSQAGIAVAGVAIAGARLTQAGYSAGALLRRRRSSGGTGSS